MNKAELLQFEKEIADLFLQGKIRCPIHLSGGNEEELITIFNDILPHDWVFSTHRNHLHYLLHTGDYDKLKKKILAGDSMHTCDPEYNFYSSSIVAGCVAIACGVALGLKLKGSEQMVYCFIGDGASDEGWTQEAIKYAAMMDLPILYIFEDNDRSVCTTMKQRWGSNKDELNQSVIKSKLLHYSYDCTWPHSGAGKWVTF
jgi:TPP-dependent pyruvate/acetoin dehydrogenase alpha subunit